MDVIRLNATSGPDGVLHLTVPVGVPGEFEVAVVVSPKPTVHGAKPKTPEELGWPPKFLESTFGSVQDEAFARYPQGEFEKREVLD
ncbi:hypothetical protein VT84_01680 [Gemmata sp. SH-PL17]|uniref:hypothetical protein n=1 Tax=Gemmata sp. SH-PL17 TaxID=1630693 RepID=UPI00078CAED3|nr:hypothetical protein [Gemmata sp. SH-PL17]AMV23092.1 hypothetical protein VT84_01680 [Gemmata sp. SH-PL17]